MINIAVIGAGYWGPNLIRNFVTCPKTRVTWVCDLDRIRLAEVLAPYPDIKQTADYQEILADDHVDAVAIATPVHTHFPIAGDCLKAGKHVLVEKPLADSVAEGEALVDLADETGLVLMCDHTFCYTGAVLKIKEIIESGLLGELLYYDSVRINLGLFQQDINVVWDLAPHDLSILDYLIEKDPLQVSAHGICHAGNNIENMAYMTLYYHDSFISHFHLNWLSPVKVRTTIISGTEKMLVWNDLDPSERIKVYDKGIEVKNGDRDKKEKLLISYRSGNMYAPSIDQREALSLVIEEFAGSIIEARTPRTDGRAGLRVLRILEDAERSIKADGANVLINGHGRNGNGVLLHRRRRIAR